MNQATSPWIRTKACGLLLTAVVVWAGPAQADEPQWKELAERYDKVVHPLVREYCQKCHSEERAEADIDLVSIKSFSKVRRHVTTWLKVSEMLESGQMPPKQSRQLAESERAQLIAWVTEYLKLEARSNGGDPGPVVLRRLSNAEYTYTIQDLTGVGTLAPAREFPADGAAGEGFTNTGNALVMSPALLTKYLDAAKEIADHAVLLPEGLRFSPAKTRRDWTNEALARIRDFYQQYAEAGRGERVNLQGVVFDTNEGGRLPIEKYIESTLIERDALRSGGKTIEQVALEHHLSPRYLGLLWNALTGNEPSVVLDGVRALWREAKPGDTAPIVAEIAAWQRSLWKFNTVGHIGKLNGPKSWLEAVNPIVARQELRFKVPAPQGAEITMYLLAGDAGDGGEGDLVVWQQPRLVAPGRPDLLLRDVRDVHHELLTQRAKIFASTEAYLAAADEAAASKGKIDVAQLAAAHKVEPDPLAAWLEYLGIAAGSATLVEGHFTQKITSAAGYDFIRGWGTHETPQLLANSSDQHVRIPGNMKPRSVAVHPSPTRRAAVGWQSPVIATARVESRVEHAHPECGNGVNWSVELRRGSTRRRLAAGTAHGRTIGSFQSEAVSLQQGDLLSISIGPRDGNHACDLTAVGLRIADTSDAGRVWDLASDVSGDVLAANPHADQLGNEAVWHFYTEPDRGDDPGTIIPPGSLVEQWQKASPGAERKAIAARLQGLLGAPPEGDGPDAQLYRQLASVSGPLFTGKRNPIWRVTEPGFVRSAVTDRAIGPDPALFGKLPDGTSTDATSLIVQAPAMIELRLPADLAAGCELVTTGALHEQAREGSVQLQMMAQKPEFVSSSNTPNDRTRTSRLVPSDLRVETKSGPWTGDNRTMSYGTPVLASDGTVARQGIEAAFDQFRNLFPAALCYSRIVPVDEVVTLTLFYREDEHFARLMLNDEQRAELNRLWDELHYISQDALTQVDAFAQLMEYATQDADPKVFEPLRKPIYERAAAFRKLLEVSEQEHLRAVIDFAALAYRRPLSKPESEELESLYSRLRGDEVPHEEAIRLTLARVLVGPAFLYRVETPPPGTESGPVSNWELACRLSYFLWSSAPDATLRQRAAAGQLVQPATLVAETRRMMQDSHVRRLATEFACQWLHIYEFDSLDEKSERHFPSFGSLRESMYEESIWFFTDLFQNDGSVLDILDADHTFVNDALAAHYGFNEVSVPQKDSVGDGSGTWRRIDGIKRFGRGGILAHATTLAKQSGASRTSPILRGNWISEVLLGERLPRPPKDVPVLPEDETATDGLTVRQLVEKHSSDPNCAVCHRRIDPLGFALEEFDAIGRHRQTDLGDRPVETQARTIDGAEFSGLDGLRTYLLTTRRDAFVRQFCRKLLGYSLGRAVQLSDEPLLDEMQEKLRAKDYRISAAVETIVLSRPFREIRGRDAQVVSHP